MNRKDYWKFQLVGVFILVAVVYATIQIMSVTSPVADSQPVAYLKIDTPQPLILGSPIVFNASGSYDNDGRIVEYEWTILRRPTWSSSYETIKITSTSSPKLIYKFYEEQNLLSKQIGRYGIILNVKDNKGKVGTTKLLDINIEKAFLMYDGIKIIGDEEFQKDVVMSLEFVKRYTLPDYLLMKKGTRVIESYVSDDAASADDFIYLNQTKFHLSISNNKTILSMIHILAHESGHTYEHSNPELTKQLIEEAEKICGQEIKNGADVIDVCTKKLGKSDFHEWYPLELFAERFAGNVSANLSYINKSEIDKFYLEFNFT